MLEMLPTKLPVRVNGVVYRSPQEAIKALGGYNGIVEVEINFSGTPGQEKQDSVPTEEVQESMVTTYRLKVRQYMTKKGSPDFDFMTKWNDSKPMPLRVMYGEILEETPGMYKMKLHGRAEKDSSSCLHCGRALTHKVSMVYGIGPICGGHGYFTTPYVEQGIEQQEKLFAEVDGNLRNTTWEGWVIKKAIEQWEEVESIPTGQQVV